MEVINVNTPLPPSMAENSSPKTSVTSGSSLKRRSVLSNAKQRASSFIDLTPHEHDFLQQLSAHGTDTQIELAWETLQDVNMFDHSDAGIVEASTATATATQITTTTTETTTVNVNIVNMPNIPNMPNMPSIPKPAPFARSQSIGSIRRNEILQQRKEQPNDMLWRAHEQGMGALITINKSNTVTNITATTNLRPNLPPITGRRRSTSMTSTNSGLNPFQYHQLGTVLRIPQRRISASSASVAATTTASSSTNADDLHILEAATDAIFRSKHSKLKRHSWKLTSQQMLFRSPPPQQRPKVRRSQSLSATSPNPNTLAGAPQMPQPRRLSAIHGRARSVTFSKDTVDTPPVLSPITRRRKMFPRKSTSDISQYKTSVSTSLGFPLQSTIGEEDGSNDSIPSIHVGTPFLSESSIATFSSSRPGMAIRSDSATTEFSIPPIQHGTMLRSESIGSVPSIRPGMAIRSDSVVTDFSIPPIQPGTALRSESTATVGSIPPIQPGIALRSDSVATEFSIPPIRPATAVRSESTASFMTTDSDLPLLSKRSEFAREDSTTFPSIRPATAVRSESSATLAPDPASTPVAGNAITALSGMNAVFTIPPPPSTNAAAMLRAQYAAADEVAETWASQGVMENTSGGGVSAGTFPTSASTTTTASASSSDEEDDEHDHAKKSKKSPRKPMLLRMASKNNYEGEGVEISESPRQMHPEAMQDPQDEDKDADADAEPEPEPYEQYPIAMDFTGIEDVDDGNYEGVHSSDIPPQNFVWFPRTPNAAAGPAASPKDITDMRNTSALFSATSFDESSYYYYKDFYRNRYESNQDGHDDIFRIRLTVSEDHARIGDADGGYSHSMAKGSFSASAGIQNENDPATIITCDNDASSDGEAFDDDDYQDSWDMRSLPGNRQQEDSPRSNQNLSAMHTLGQRFDSWNIVKDDYVNGYGGGGTLGFSILGTSADDVDASPHVLSPPLMESLQAFLPYSKSGENFYLKYSLVRDGAALSTFLQRARGAQYTILAMETVDGEVFGSFTGQAWRKNWKFFGTGECFLWRMRNHRLAPKNRSLLEQAQLESEIDVYPYTGANKCIQMCTHDLLAVGGGIGDNDDDDDGETKTGDPLYYEEENQTAATINTNNSGVDFEPQDWGFGLTIDGDDLLHGTSSPCHTFGSPSLSKVHSNGSRFEIVNLELWTLTPCMTEEQAERMELSKLFLDRHLVH